MTDPADYSFRVAFGRRPSEFGIVAWSPDGRWIAATGGDGVIWLWRADSGKCFLLEGHTGAVNHVAWSPDSSTLASGSADKTVRVWDAARGREKMVLEGHEAGVTHLAWSPDSRVLASCDACGAIRIWAAAAGQLLLQAPPRP